MENSPVVLEVAPDRSRVLRSVLWTLLLFVVILGAAVWILGVVPYLKFARNLKVESARKFAEEIAAAISTFHASYDALPIDSHGVDWVGTTADGHGLVAVLTGAQRPEVMLRNPKKINFLDGFKQAKKEVFGKVVDGIDDETDPLLPAIYDLWGQPFIVIMDTNKDQVIANPLKSGGVLLTRGKKALVYSTGPPNADGTRNTDESNFITSW